jgi:hypothetical protein
MLNTTCYDEKSYFYIDYTINKYCTSSDNQLMKITQNISDIKQQNSINLIVNRVNINMRVVFTTAYSTLNWRMRSTISFRPKVFWRNRIPVAIATQDNILKIALSTLTNMYISQSIPKICSIYLFVPHIAMLNLHSNHV